MFAHYSRFYFFYYAALGAYSPYVGRWVDSQGYPGEVVGIMLGLWYASRIIAPPLWTWQVHRSTKPGHWLVIGMLLTSLSFAGFTLTDSLWPMLSVMAVFGFFYNAIMPQFEAMTLNALGEDKHRYGQLRVWGSIGFLLVASSYGAIMDRLGDASFVWITLPLLAAALLSAWPHRDEPLAEHDGERPRFAHFWTLLKRPGVAIFLLLAMLMQIGFGAFYVYYTLHLQGAGHDGLTVGLLWGLGVAIEIALFWHAPDLIQRFGIERLMRWCIGITVLRWAVTAYFAHSLPLMALAQCSHALGFALLHACFMQRLTQLFPPHEASHGQSLMYGLSSGMGGVIGALLAAFLWRLGEGSYAFMGGASITFIAWLLVLQQTRASASR